MPDSGFCKFSTIHYWEKGLGQVSNKIDRLMEFDDNKGYDYDQIPDNKPGKTTMTETLKLYCAETNSSSFEKQLKNNLDEILVKNIESIENGQALNIENTVSLAFSEFNKYLQSN